MTTKPANNKQLIKALLPSLDRGSVVDFAASSAEENKEQQRNAGMFHLVFILPANIRHDQSAIMLLGRERGRERESTIRGMIAGFDDECGRVGREKGQLHGVRWRGSRNFPGKPF